MVLVFGIIAPVVELMLNPEGVAVKVPDTGPFVIVIFCEVPILFINVEDE